VFWEIQIEADSPEEAARHARAAQLRPDMPATVFEVREHAGKRMHRVDVAGHAGMLDRTELTAIRARLRLLQCRPDVHPAVREIAPVLLIFLDREDWIEKRCSRGWAAGSRDSKPMQKSFFR
jgi:hypothetical protein